MSQNVSFIFFDFNQNSLRTPDGLTEAIDTDSLRFTKELKFGERSLDFRIFANQSAGNVYYNFFKLQVYAVFLKIEGVLVWVGIKAKDSPKRPSYKNGNLEISFTGYIAITERLIDKRWITRNAQKMLISPASRATNGDQLDSSIELDGNKATFRILHDNQVVQHGVERSFWEYEASGGYFINAVEMVSRYRSGEGVQFGIYNLSGGPSRFVHVDLTDTGDQETLKTFNIPYTLAGVDTRKIEYRIGTSLTDVVVLDYGDGVDSFVTNMAIGENTLVLPFRKDFSRWVSEVRLTLWSGINPGVSMTAAIYDDSQNLLGQFDNTVLLPAAPTQIFFTSAGGLNIGASTGATLMYFLVIKFGASNQFCAAIGRSGAGPWGAYLNSGYTRRANIPGAFPASITETSTHPSQWVKMSFDLVLPFSELYDQNDLVVVEDAVHYLKYEVGHPDKGNEAYTVKELLIDGLLVALYGSGTIFDTDYSTIADTIFGGLPVDEAALESSDSYQLRTLLNKLIALSSTTEYTYYINAFDNAGVPKLTVRQRNSTPSDNPITDPPNFNVSVNDENVTFESSTSETIINYVIVSYVDQFGVPRTMSPRSHPTLTNNDPIKYDYYFNGGQITEAEALAIGEGIIANFANPRAGGSLRIKNQVRLGLTQVMVHVSRINHGDRIIVFDYTDPSGVVNPIYEIVSVTFTNNTDEVLLTFDDKRDLARVIESFRTPLNISK
jgi:hypothetical protein